MTEAYIIQNLALQKFAQGCSVNEVMDVLSNGIEEKFPDSLCSILVLNDEEKSLYNCSSPSLPSEFIQAINGLKVGPMNGSCGSAAYKKELVKIEDMTKDPLCKKFRSYVSTYKLNSCWSHPIFSSKNEVLGTFAVYNKSPSKNEQHQINFTSTLANVAGLVLEGKKAIGKLAESEDRFKSIMTQAGDAFFVHDFEGKFIDVNERACLSLGYSREELLNMSVPDVEKNFRPEKLEKVWEELCLGSSITLQGEHCRKDGTRFPVEVNLGQIIMNNQNCFLASARDITQRKKREEQILNESKFTTENPFPVLRISEKGELLYFNTSSKLLNQKYNFEIGNDIPLEWKEHLFKVLSSKKPAEFEDYIEGRWYVFSIIPVEGMNYLNIYGLDITVRKNVEKDLDDFAQIASHDLQEPLRKINIFGDRLMEITTGIDEKSRDCIQRMQQASKRMSRFIEDLLGYSKISAQSMSYETVDLEKSAQRVCEQLDYLIKSNNAVINTSNLPKVDGLKNQLDQLFSNLIINSIKFKRKDANLIININGRKEENGYWTILVEDNGIGLDEKYSARIFQPFQRLHGKSEYEGSGLGLSISKKIVDRHNGTISVKSKLGEGATFMIHLPSKQTPTA
jgi:PAS domain S-box-containing protein